MKTFDKLGEMLMKRYVADFMSHMQNIASPLYSTLRPSCAVFQSTSNDLEYVAKVLFREKTMDKWAVWKMPDEMREDWPWESVLGHQCRRMGPVAFMSLHSNADEVCWRCSDPMPKKLVGLWKLQNYDNYTGVLNG
jgi:hypothetical protein